MGKSDNNIDDEIIVHFPEEFENKGYIYKRLIYKFSGKEVYDFIAKYAGSDNNNCSLLYTNSQFNIDVLARHRQSCIINLQKINDIYKLSKFFRAINSKLDKDGIFIGCVETNWAKKNKIYSRHPAFIAFFYFVIYFIFKRIFSKLFMTKGLYYFITRGRNRPVSKAETFGRLIYSGFEIIDFFDFHYLKYFVAKKVKSPIMNVKPSMGIVLKMNRIGKGGKIFTVYKLRTMHPYSEYLQEYVYKINQLDKGGKFKDDFRISTLGRFMRKLWIDELPMIFNILKGDMKIIGVRPLSEQYFNLYTKELQEKRIKFKPGLIPPFYIDNPESLNEIMASEMKYLTQYENNPLFTDLIYFFRFLKMLFYKIIGRKQVKSLIPNPI